MPYSNKFVKLILLYSLTHKSGHDKDLPFYYVGDTFASGRR